MHFHSNEISSNPHNPVYKSPYSQYTAPVRYFLNKSSSYDQHYYISKAAVDFLSMNRLLWLEHVNWTRMTITSIVFNLPDLPSVQARLLQNATDLGNCLRPFYGDQIADKYAELIKEHLVLAAELVTAAVKGDTKKAEEKEKEWYRNADDIAIFLSNINPYLTNAEVQRMFYKHLALTKQEAVYMIQKNYEEDIKVFDQIEAEALEMSDMIAQAIIMQFPHMF
ncbi:hypothetical protein SAMN05518871_103364 [Psychrobacillus sp. OK028]|uniref:hypothetical protein n=1 Tax=Psychrobacillus sp. OK028 TaxID=1884359 RepID=UPI0008893724|nr:hypothetical protein [Psychrobacillus sp. OK028]SDN12671.1 hypothetical protein SAMN05518871_103364 [Psychrobacillus sp. OK028]